MSHPLGTIRVAKNWHESGTRISPPSAPPLRRASSYTGGVVFTSGTTLSAIDEALFHLALANLPADLRQQRIDQLLDMRLERMNADA